MAIERPKKIERKSDVLENVSNKRKHLMGYRQELNEKISRFDDIEYLKKVMMNSDSLLDVYLQFDGDKDLLVAFGVLRQDELTLFEYLDENGMLEDVDKSYASPIDNDIVNAYSKLFDDFMNRHHEFDFNKNETFLLPDIFVFGTRDDFEKIEMMNISDNVYPLFDNDDFERLSISEDKVIIGFNKVDKNSLPLFKQAMKKQRLKIIRSIDIVPFNRKNIERKVLQA